MLEYKVQYSSPWCLNTRCILTRSLKVLTVDLSVMNSVLLLRIDPCHCTKGNF